MSKAGKMHALRFGAAIIEYELIYSRRKTLGIHVYPNARVIVRAPLHADFALIEAQVMKRGAWILKHQRQFKAAPTPTPQPLRCADGEIIRYLGEPYRLHITQDRVERVRLDGNSLVISVRDPARATALLDRWYRKQAERVFAERLAACFPRVEVWGVKFPPMRIRNMKTRWGSCSSKGSVSLNLKLIHMPVELIDYVVLHELCHLKELNHSPAFWKLMDRVLPDWKTRRARLNQTHL